MKEALMNLGFYSGDEDMEFSSFSSGTERAVKTWQASIGVREDGVMTLELLDRLYAPQRTQISNPSESPPVNADVPKVGDNVREVQQTFVKKVSADVDVSKNRWHFLLGENRWEDSSRLNKGNDKLGGGVQAHTSVPTCLVCRGEGRLLCMECEGTGEPQVEEQFLDWMDGGAKCPYCEGLGYTICDICDGKGAA